MIPNVSTGSRMFGLVQYLAGPGRSNEHTNMHVVCASEQIVTVLDRQDLDAVNSRELGREMEFPKKAYRPGDLERSHVLHVSLSLDPSQLGESGLRDDEFWETVSRKYVSEMALDGKDGKAPCRWVAVRHGLSKNGNDHVHLAISMIREDGTWWSDYKSKFKSQKAARVIEKELGLTVLGQGLKTKGTQRGELESLCRRRAEAAYAKEAKKDSAMVPWSMLDKGARDHLVKAERDIQEPRVDLARRLRGAGAGAQTEAEYVQRLRGTGLLVRPYFAKGSTDSVAGYSVAFRPIHGERPIWYGGGTLAKDLALPSLRQQWPGADVSAAVPEWKAAAKNKAFAKAIPAGAEVVSAEMLSDFFKEMKDVTALFRDVRSTDPERFAQIARQGAGVLSAWSVAAGAEGDAAAKQLSAAADVFAKHSQLAEEPRRAVVPMKSVFAAIATHQAIGLSRRAGASAVMGVWSDFGTQLAKGFTAHHYGHAAQQLATEARANLASVQRAYLSVDANPFVPKITGTTTAQGQAQGQGRGEGAASNVAVLDRDAATTTTRTPAGPTKAQGAPKSRAQSLAELESQLRAGGASEQAIKARLQGERLVSGSTPTGKKPQSTQAPTRTPASGQSTGNEQSTDQHKGRGSR